MTSQISRSNYYKNPTQLPGAREVLATRRSVCNEELSIAYFEAELLTQTDYYSFGAVMPDRRWSAGAEGYRYGFDGMERVDEVKGGGDSYTTEYIQYEPRLGRWFSIDPVVKSCFSSYVAYKNIPFLFIDPKGDDDIFSRDGKFLGRTAIGNSIRVVDQGMVLDQALEILAKSSTLLTDIEFPEEDKQSRGMLVLIVGYYAAQVGIIDPVIISKSSFAGKVASYNSEFDEFNVYLNSETKRINSDLGKVFNLINTWSHEKEHQDNKRSWNRLYHPEAILAQVGDERWMNTTKRFKKRALNYAGGLLQQAIDEGYDVLDDQGMIDRLISSDLSEVRFISIEDNEILVTLTFEGEIGEE